MPRKSIFSNITVEIPKGCDVDKKRLYVYYRKNTIRRPYRDRPGTYPDHERVCVGKAVPPDSPGEKFQRMVPNANFPDVLFRILKAGGASDEEAALEVGTKLGISFSPASGSEGPSPQKLCIREETAYRDHVSLGLFTAVCVLAKDCGLMDDLAAAFGQEDLFLLLDLAQFRLSERSAAFSRFPHWAASHAHFADSIPSDKTVHEFLTQRLTQRKINAFRKLWAERTLRDDRVSLLIDCVRAGSFGEGVILTETGYGKEDFSYDLTRTAFVFRKKDGLPVTYFKIPGLANESALAGEMLSLLRTLCAERNQSHQAQGFPNLKADWICERGLISKLFVSRMEETGIGFLLLLRPDTLAAEEILLDHLEEIRLPDNYVPKLDIYAWTAEGRLFPEDEKTRFFHLIWNGALECDQKKQLTFIIEKMEEDLQEKTHSKQEMTQEELAGYSRYFTLTLETAAADCKKRTGEGNALKGISTYRITSAVRKEREIYLSKRLCGYQVLVSSEPVSAADSYLTYRRQNGVRTFFSWRGDQFGTDTDDFPRFDALDGETFITFLASILYCMIREKTFPLQVSDRKAFAASSVIDHLEEYEAGLDPDSFRHILRYAPTHSQELVFHALGIESSDLLAALKRIEHVRINTTV